MTWARTWAEHDTTWAWTWRWAWAWTHDMGMDMGPSVMEVWHDMARHDMARHDMAWHDSMGLALSMAMMPSHDTA